MAAEEAATVAGLMALVSEFGQCRWSEGSSGATYLDRMGERRSREEAADLYQQIEAYAARLAAGVPKAVTPSMRRHVEQALAAVQRLWDTPKAQQNTAIQLGEVAGHLRAALGVKGLDE